MAFAYLGLGTNIGNKRRNMITAAALLAERVGDILALQVSMKRNRGGSSRRTFS